MRQAKSEVSELGNPEIATALRGSLRLPLIAAPMFLISGPSLVIAACRAGIIGAFPATNARTISDLESWCEQIREFAGPKAVPWALNVIVHPTYPRLSDEIEIIGRFQPPLVITALGSPKGIVPIVRSYGGLVFADVGDPIQARKAVDSGVDGLVLVCAGAGGHTGRFSPFALVEEVRRFWRGPLVLAGAVGSGRVLRAAEVLGADLAYIGTSLIAASESLAADDYKQMVVDCSLTDIVASAAITGIPASWMKPSLDQAGFTPDMLDVRKKIDLASAVADIKAWKTLWSAGQGVGSIRRIEPVCAIVERIACEYEEFAQPHRSVA